MEGKNADSLENSHSSCEPHAYDQKKTTVTNSVSASPSKSGVQAKILDYYKPKPVVVEYSSSIQNSQKTTEASKQSAVSEEPSSVYEERADLSCEKEYNDLSDSLLIISAPDPSSCNSDSCLAEHDQVSPVERSPRSPSAAAASSALTSIDETSESNGACVSEVSVSEQRSTEMCVVDSSLSRESQDIYCTNSDVNTTEPEKKMPEGGVPSSSCFTVTDSQVPAVDPKQLDCFIVKVVAGCDADLAEQPNLQDLSAEETSVSSERKSAVDTKCKISRKNVARHSLKASEHRNFKGRRISAKMKTKWAEELEANGHLVCPIQGCHQTYVTVANFQTHYKYCTGRKKLQHCPYCESLIFSGNEAVLRHMEVEHPERVEEYKEKCAAESAVKGKCSANSESLPEVRHEVCFQSSSPDSVQKGKGISQKKKIKSARRNNSSKENFLQRGKTFKQGLKSIERTMDQNLKQFQNCVRFNDIVQKINSFVTEDAVDDAKKLKSGSTDLKRQKQRKSILHETTIQASCISEDSVDDVSPSCDSPSDDSKLPRKVTTKSRIVLNTQGYERFNQYLKLTRDWASERKTYSRSRGNEHSANFSDNGSSLPGDVHDVYQLNDTVGASGMSLATREDLQSTDLMELLIGSSIKKVSDKTSNSAVSQPQCKKKGEAVHAYTGRENVSVYHSKVEESQKNVKVATQSSFKQIAGEENYGHILFSMPSKKITNRERSTCYDNAGSDSSSKAELQGLQNGHVDMLSHGLGTHCSVPSDKDNLPLPLIDFDQLIAGDKSAGSVANDPKCSDTGEVEVTALELQNHTPTLNTSECKQGKKKLVEKYRKQDGVKVPKSSKKQDGLKVPVQSKQGKVPRSVAKHSSKKNSPSHTSKKNTAKISAITYELNINHSSSKNVPQEETLEKSESITSSVLEMSVEELFKICWAGTESQLAPNGVTGQPPTLKVLSFEVVKKTVQQKMLRREFEERECVADKRREFMNGDECIQTQAQHVIEENGVSITISSVCRDVLKDVIEKIISEKTELLTAMGKNSIPDWNTVHHSDSSGSQLPVATEYEKRNLVKVVAHSKAKKEKPACVPKNEKETAAILREESNEVPVNGLSESEASTTMLKKKRGRPCKKVSTGGVQEQDDNIPKSTGNIDLLCELPSCNEEASAHAGIICNGAVEKYPSPSSEQLLLKSRFVIENELEKQILNVDTVKKKRGRPRKQVTAAAEEHSGVETAMLSGSNSSLKHPSEGMLILECKGKEICEEKEGKLYKENHVKALNEDTVSCTGTDSMNGSSLSSPSIKGRPRKRRIEMNSQKELVTAVVRQESRTLTANNGKLSDCRKDVYFPNVLEGSGDCPNKIETLEHANSSCDINLVVSKSDLSDKNGFVDKVSSAVSERKNSLWEDSISTCSENFDQTSTSSYQVSTHTPLSAHDDSILGEKKKRGRPKKKSALDFSVDSERVGKMNEKQELLQKSSDVNCVSKNSKKSDEATKDLEEIMCAVDAASKKCAACTCCGKFVCAKNSSSSSMLVCASTSLPYNSAASDKMVTQESFHEEIGHCNVNEIGPSADQASSGDMHGNTDAEKEMCLLEKKSVIRKSSRKRKIKVDPDAVFTQPRRTAKSRIFESTVVTASGKKSKQKDRSHEIASQNAVSCPGLSETMVKGQSAEHSSSVQTRDKLSAVESTVLSPSEENTYRKGSRKGRPRKCVRYADINSCIERPECLDDVPIFAHKSSSTTDVLKDNMSENGKEKCAAGEENTSSMPSTVHKKRFCREKGVRLSRCSDISVQKKLLKSSETAMEAAVSPGFKQDRKFIVHSRTKRALLAKAKLKNSVKDLKEKSVSNNSGAIELSSVSDREVQEFPEKACSSKRVLRGAAKKARQMLLNLVQSDKVSRSQDVAAGNRREKDADFVLPVSGESELSSSNEDESYVEDFESELFKFKDHYSVPDGCPPEDLVAPKQLVDKWAKQIASEGKVVCEREGCGKVLESKLGMVYHYERACLRAQRRWLCKICDKRVKPSPKVMLKHLNQKHSSLLNTGKIRSLRPKPPLHRSLYRDIILSAESLSKHECVGLFQEYMPKKSMWVLLEHKESVDCLPPLMESVSFKICNQSKSDNSSWQRLPCFGSYCEKNNSHTATFFTGGPVWSCAWCPTPRETEVVQHIALASGSDMEDSLHSFSTQRKSGLIQIWEAGFLNGISVLSVPVLRLAVPHTYGNISDMAWCPTGCWDDPFEKSVQSDDCLSRLGMLAVACSDSYIRIFSIPQPSCLNSSGCLPFYKTSPVVVLKPQFESSIGSALVAQVAVCLAVSWQKTDRCELIIGGYGSGLVSVWQLKKGATSCVTKIPNKPDIISPFLTFQAHGAAVTSVDFAPLPGGRWCASSSYDKSLRIWDLHDIGMPVFERKRGNARCVKWPSVWTGVFVGLDDGLNLSGCTTFYEELAGVKSSVMCVSMQNACQWSCTVSEWLNVAAAADAAGEVTACQLSKINVGHHKQYSRKRFPIFRTEMEALEGKSLMDFKNSYDCRSNNLLLEKMDRMCEVAVVMEDIVSNVCAQQPQAYEKGKICPSRLYEKNNFVFRVSDRVVNTSSVNKKYVNAFTARRALARKVQYNVNKANDVTFKGATIFGSEQTRPIILEDTSLMKRRKTAWSKMFYRERSIRPDHVPTKRSLTFSTTCSFSNDQCNTVAQTSVYSSDVHDTVNDLLVQCETLLSSNNLHTDLKYSNKSSNTEKDNSCEFMQHSAEHFTLGRNTNGCNANEIGVFSLCRLTEEKQQLARVPDLQSVFRFPSHPRYRAVENICGLVFVDQDLVNPGNIPENEIERVRKENTKAFNNGLMCPIASVNCLTWNPNIGSHFWLLTAGHSGLARLICAPGLQHAESVASESDSVPASNSCVV